MIQITFKVYWNARNTVLADFRNFLAAVFHSRRHFLSLRVVQQSLLTFVCTLPNWLVVEIDEFVRKNRCLFTSGGIVQVEINESVIFKMVSNYTYVYILYVHQ